MPTNSSQPQPEAPTAQHAESQPIVPIADMPYRGPIREEKAEVVDYFAAIEGPDAKKVRSEDHPGYHQAEHEARNDSMQNVVFIGDPEAGDTYVGYEFPNVFAFRGRMRSTRPDKETIERAERSHSAFSEYWGDVTQVYFDLEDGTIVEVEKTNPDERAANDQNFKLTVVYPDDRGVVERSIDTTSLEGVAVRPKGALRFGEDPSTGRSLTFRSRVARITGINSTEVIPPSRLNMWDEPSRKERDRNVLERFHAQKERAEQHQATGSTALTEAVDVLTVTEAEPTLTYDTRFAGTADPTLRALARGDDVPEAQRQKVFVEARNHVDGSHNKAIVRDSNGDLRWAKYYPEVFTFDGVVRSEYAGEEQPESGTGVRGNHTHVLICFEDDNAVLIRRDKDAQSNTDQKFMLHSTRAGGDREIYTSQLDGIVVVPGEPLVMGPVPGKTNPTRSKAKVSSVYTFSMYEGGKVAPEHPDLSNPSVHSDVLEQFDARYKAAHAATA